MATKRKLSSKNYALLSDQPVFETGPRTDDGLGRNDALDFDRTAEVLALAALHTREPITIGVYGNWGTGKTSLMRLMMKVVEDQGRGEHAAVPVWFNAWQYEREEHLVIPLLATIAREIRNREKTWTKAFKEGGEKVHAALRSVLYGIAIKGKLDAPLLGKLEVSTSMKDMIERYEALTQDTMMARSLYFDAFDQLRELASDASIKKPQIVVFIDDLDRCFPENAVRLLENIKLVLHQPNFAFVLGIYPEIIEDFVRNKYAAKFAMKDLASSGDEGRNQLTTYLKYFNNYLGKIVQVAHRVPEREPKGMRGYIRELLHDAGAWDAFVKEGVREEELFDLIAEVGKRNPREIVREINRLLVQSRIDKTFDPLSGLIDGAIDDRQRRPESRDRVRTFIHLIGLTAGETGGTHGAVLASELRGVASLATHEARLESLLGGEASRRSVTIKTLIDTLDSDPTLLNVLCSGAGQAWLSSRETRLSVRQQLADRDDEADPIDGVKVSTEKLETRSVPPAEPSKRQGDYGWLPPGLRLVEIPAGEFQMGSPPEEEGHSSIEGPRHRVKISAFRMSDAPITQGQYEAVVGVNPSHFQEMLDSSERPVVGVSWNAAREFCALLTERSGSKFQFMLPSEAQWEYACRAGSASRYCLGNSEEQLGEYAWYRKNAVMETHPIRQKKPNKFSLYDMHGNVWEWCEDIWHDYYHRAPSDGSARKDESRNPLRVIRGGSWRNEASRCRSASRLSATFDARGDAVGFRVIAVRRDAANPSGASND